MVDILNIIYIFMSRNYTSWLDQVIQSPQYSDGDKIQCLKEKLFKITREKRQLEEENQFLHRKQALILKQQNQNQTSINTEVKSYLSESLDQYDTYVRNANSPLGQSLIRSNRKPIFESRYHQSQIMEQNHSQIQKPDLTFIRSQHSVFDSKISMQSPETGKFFVKNSKKRESQFQEREDFEYYDDREVSKIPKSLKIDIPSQIEIRDASPVSSPSNNNLVKEKIVIQNFMKQKQSRKEGEIQKFISNNLSFLSFTLEKIGNRQDQLSALGSLSEKIVEKMRQLK